MPKPPRRFKDHHLHTLPSRPRYHSPTFLLRKAWAMRPWAPKLADSVKSRIQSLVELFAAIVMTDRLCSRPEVEAALDFLRYSFPEADHVWLAEQFWRAIGQERPLAEVATIVGANLSKVESIAITLEAIVLLKNARNDQGIEQILETLCSALNIPGYGSRLSLLLESPGEAPPPEISSLTFSASDNPDVILPVEDAPARLRVLRCDYLTLLVNDGDIPLRARGRTLPPNGLMPISPGQLVSFPASTISYSELAFFFGSKTTKVQTSYFLAFEDDALIAQRTRTRTSILQVNFALDVTITLLKKSKNTVTVDGLELQPSSPVTTTYNALVSVGSQGPYQLSDLRRRTEDFGKRFEMDPETRVIRVTNIPDHARKGDLLLTPGLAGPATLEVSINRKENRGFLQIIQSNDQIEVNGRTVRGSCQLNNGDLIRISFNQSLRCRFDVGVLDEERNLIHKLQVSGLTHQFNPNERVLDNINFTVQRGEMVCILGPSGSGKSTLLATLAGFNPPSRGSVRYNNYQLYDLLPKLAPLIAYIPKEDVLNPQLTVAEQIFSCVTIRRPRLSARDRNRRTEAIMRYVGLTHLANRLIGKPREGAISDGERSRLNLGLDLAGIADVFLLDEPISGLSSYDAEQVVDTLENIARDKIVLATLHRPNSRLLHRFQKVLLLDHGGQIAFWGTPEEMQAYFRLAAEELGIVIPAHSASLDGADYVFEILEAPMRWHDRKRRQFSRLWQERFENHWLMDNLARKFNSLGTLTHVEEVQRVPSRPRRTLVQYLRLTLVWIRRALYSRIRSKASLYTTLLEGPLLALLIGWTLRAPGGASYNFKDALHIPSFFFLSTVVAMFFGLITAATEILRDRPLLRRERNANPFLPGYLLAKALVLSLLVCIQCALYLLVSNSILEIHDVFLPLLTTMSLTGFVGVSISLLVSSLVRSERTALNIVPLLLVPQILLAGAMIPFSEMNHFVPWAAHRMEKDGKMLPGRVPIVADFCPLRYSYESMIVAQATTNPFAREQETLQSYVQELKDKTRLTPEERKRLIRARNALLPLSSMEEVSPTPARRLLRTIRRAGLAPSDEALTKLQNQPPQEVDGKSRPLPHFFVNDRIDSLHSLAEAWRTNHLDHSRQPVFLAKRRPFPILGESTTSDALLTEDYDTLDINHSILLLMGLFFLTATGVALQRQLKISPRHS